MSIVAKRSPVPASAEHLSKFTQRADSAENFNKVVRHTEHTSNMSLHYLVKYSGPLCDLTVASGSLFCAALYVNTSEQLRAV